ncbi:MAG: deoxyribose-phosphate aldolase [Desulfotomaculales bacterium]
MTPQEFARLLDATMLRPEATRADIIALCREAREFGFATVCVNPCYVRLVRQQLEGSPVKVCTVIGFPLGATTLNVKVLEAREAAMDGIDEMDVVLNIGALKEGDTKFLMNELDKVIEAARDVRRDITVKVILETGLLTDAEKLLACWVATGAGADFVKTSTGYGPSGATIEDVRFLRNAVGPHFGVKAAGGIRDLPFARALLDAGANRLGTSAAARLMRQWQNEGDNTVE